jgi:ATP-dependent DNA helicase
MGSHEEVPKGMKEEEERMKAQRAKDDAKRNAELEQERQADHAGGTEILDKKFQQLEFLMNKNKLYANVMLAQMQRQEGSCTKAVWKAGSFSNTARRQAGINCDVR